MGQLSYTVTWNNGSLGGTFTDISQQAAEASIETYKHFGVWARWECKEKFLKSEVVRGGADNGLPKPTIGTSTKPNVIDDTLILPTKPIYVAATDTLSWWSEWPDNSRTMNYDADLQIHHTITGKRVGFTLHNATKHIGKEWANDRWSNGPQEKGITIWCEQEKFGDWHVQDSQLGVGFHVAIPKYDNTTNGCPGWKICDASLYIKPTTASTPTHITISDDGLEEVQGPAPTFGIAWEEWPGEGIKDRPTISGSEVAKDPLPVLNCVMPNVSVGVDTVAYEDTKSPISVVDAAGKVVCMDWSNLLAPRTDTMGDSVEKYLAQSKQPEPPKDWKQEYDMDDKQLKEDVLKALKNQQGNLRVMSNQTSTLSPAYVIESQYGKVSAPTYLGCLALYAHICPPDERERILATIAEAQ